MPTEKFTIQDEESGQTFGPFGRRATYDHAVAHHNATGHCLTIISEQTGHPVACCMHGNFLVEVPHDEEGNSLPCEPWLPDDEIGLN
jgi:hypothetical protein